MSHILQDLAIYMEERAILKISLSPPQPIAQCKTPTKTQVIVRQLFFIYLKHTKFQGYFFYFKLTSCISPTLKLQYKVIIGPFYTEIKITLVFYIYHGFFMQQFRTLLHCFHLFIVAHY